MSGPVDYRAFVRAKSQLDGAFGFKASFQHPAAYDFQQALVEWAVEQGRAALFADCGLGKTLMQLAWGHNVNRESNRPVLLLAPLMVSVQAVEEGEKFGFDVERSLDGTFSGRAGIVTTNYERLDRFDPHQFAGVICDESSILKNFDGATKGALTEFMRLIKYRLLCSATPSPNDYIELGTSSEALGQLGYMDMLGMFFTSNEDSLHPAWIGSQWRFKSHAESSFWRWVCSWARAIRKPSDMGFDDGPFVLPALLEREHLVKSPTLPGNLFALPTQGLTEEREERRATIDARCVLAAEALADATQAVAWCHLNAEATALLEVMPGAVQVQGSDADERKIEVFQAFKAGEIARLVTKPKIAAFGLNWQHCNRMSYFADHSFEQYYQAVRRMLRFGQARAVGVDIIASESLAGVVRNQRRKAAATEQMFARMVAAMTDALSVDRFSQHRQVQELPSWL
jgi:hypothetical protein